MSEHSEPAVVRLKPTLSLPVAVGDVPTIMSLEPNGKLSGVAEICSQLVMLGRQRRHCIKSQSRCDRSIEAFLAGLLGYRNDLAEDDRAKLFAQAQRIRVLIEKNGPGWRDERFDPEIVAVAQMVLNSAVSRKVWDEFRANIETQMKALAKQLPVWDDWAKGVLGLGQLGLAVIISEAGRDLTCYGTVAKLWKRLGLGMIEHPDKGWMRQQKRTDKDEAAQHGYQPSRRAEMWAFFSDTMIRAVWRGQRCSVCDTSPSACRCPKPKPEIIAGYPISPYGADYARKKEEYLAREWTPKHADEAARRYMTKCVIRDLWVAWRHAE